MVVAMSNRNTENKVSIITPLYNSSAFIRETLASLLNQTNTNWESILVDDGSTDDTALVVEPFLKDKRFRYLWQENQGIAAARNLGVRAASGDWICLLDHDDRWFPTKLEKQMSYALANNCQILGTDAFIVERASRWIYSDLFKEQAASVERSVTDPSIDVFGILIKTNFICTCSVMLRKSLFDKHGLFDPRAEPADDFDMWLRCMPDATMGFLNEPLVEYFRHESNHSNDEVRMLEKLLYTLQKNARRHRGNGKRVQQFNESMAWQYDVLFGKLINQRAHTLILKHALKLLARGRPGFRILSPVAQTLYHTFVTPLSMRLGNSIRYRLRWIRNLSQ